MEETVESSAPASKKNMRRLHSKTVSSINVISSMAIKSCKLPTLLIHGLISITQTLYKGTSQFNIRAPSLRQLHSQKTPHLGNTLITSE